MQRLLSGLVALPFLASVALAAPPALLNDAQMDAVTAGQTTTSGGLTFLPASGSASFSAMVLFFINETHATNTGTVSVTESGIPCAECFLNVGPPNLVVQAQFGPPNP